MSSHLNHRLCVIDLSLSMTHNNTTPMRHNTSKVVFAIFPDLFYIPLFLLLFFLHIYFVVPVVFSCLNPHLTLGWLRPCYPWV